MVRQKLIQVWFFTIYGIPEIWRHKVTEEQSRWLIIKAAWITAGIIARIGWRNK